MKLSDDDVTKFRRIYKNAYCEEMPGDDARMFALRLVRLYRILLRPTPAELADQLAKSRALVTLDLPAANTSTHQ